MYRRTCQQTDERFQIWLAREQDQKAGTQMLSRGQKSRMSMAQLASSDMSRHLKLHKHLAPTQHRRNMCNRRKQCHNSWVDKKFCWNYTNRISSRQDMVNNRRWLQKICSSARQENLAEQSKKQSKPWDTTVAGDKSVSVSKRKRQLIIAHVQ